MTVLELRDVRRVQGGGETAVHALDGVSLTVGPGELVAVMGPSGSGKSTLLNLCGGLDSPTSGTVLVDGTSPRSLSRRQLAAWRRIPQPDGGGPAISAVMADVIGAVAVSVVLTSQAQQAGTMGDVSVYTKDTPVHTDTALPDTSPPHCAPPCPQPRSTRSAPDVRRHRVHGPPPADRECPYALDVLEQEPTEAEQQAALQDRRCDDVVRSHRYFGAFTTPNRFLAVTTPDAVATLLHLSQEDAEPARTAMAAGKVTPDTVADDHVLISTRMRSGTVRAPAHAVLKATAPLALMTERTARSPGFEVESFALYATTTRMPTTAEQDGTP